MPSIARIILEQTCDSGVDEALAVKKDHDVEEAYRKELY